MNAEDNFVSLAASMCEPTRARMLWNLLDGRAYTASELSLAAHTSPTSASNHLSKLLEAALVKVEIQGRHRYYSLSSHEVAYAVESLAQLAGNDTAKSIQKIPKEGIKYCRTCYDHLAGYVAVQMVEAMENKGYLSKSEGHYEITEKGWTWFQYFELSKETFIFSRRPLTRQCLDWSERRSHLGGQLGALWLQKMLERKWFKKVAHSRTMIITSKGQKELYDLLNIVV